MAFARVQPTGKERLSLWMVWGPLHHRAESMSYPQSFLRKALKLYIEKRHFHRENRTLNQA
jgi:hypothetical protein